MINRNYHTLSHRNPIFHEGDLSLYFNTYHHFIPDSFSIQQFHIQQTYYIPIMGIWKFPKLKDQQVGEDCKIVRQFSTKWIFDQRGCS